MSHRNPSHEAKTGEPSAADKQHRADEKTYWNRQIRISKILNWLTGVAAFVGLGGLWFLYASIVDANRAWISPVAPYFNEAPVVGQPIEVIFPYENVGREPAIDIKRSVYFDVVELSSPKMNLWDLPKPSETVCEDYPALIFMGPLFPTKGTSIFGASTSDQNIIWNTALDSGKSVLRARGCISYITFGKRHYSWFCKLFSTTVTMNEDRNRRVGTGCNGAEGAT